MKAHLIMLAGVGAGWALVPVPVIVAVSAVTVVLLVRRPLPMTVAMFCLVSVLGQRALAGLDPPPAGPVDGWLTLLDDPRPAGPYGVRFTARHDGKRVAVSAHGPVAGKVDDLLAGERVRVRGALRPVGADDAWAKWRHEVGRVTIVEVLDTAPAAPLARLANTIRRTLTRGAEPLDRGGRAVFLGMVIGDDRGQAPATADDFRAAGLGHLLVVSGQNVAFVLAVVGPLVVVLRPGPRVVVLITVLLVFAVLTRFEPSVLRAVAMAGVGVGAAALGTPVDGRRGLSWAVAGLVLVDPFLVHVVAFQLSAAATAGIVWLSPGLTDRLPGPLWFRLPLATTASAQLGVSPVLLATFGPLPLATLPANLLAGPASGPVMVWGCTGGLVAGMTGGVVAEVIHIPTRVMLWWIQSVAGVAARGPQVMIGRGALAVIAVSMAVLVLGRRPARIMATLAMSVLLAASVRSAASLPAGETSLGQGLTIHADGDAAEVVVLDGPGPPRGVLETLRTAGVGRPEIIVAVDGDAADAFAVIAINDKYGEVAVMAPPLHRVPGATTVHERLEVVVGGLRISVTEHAGRLEVSGSTEADHTGPSSG